MDGYCTIAPSILSADFSALGDDIRKVEAAGAKVLHIDVMDGHFVPSISLGMPIIRSIRKKSDMIFDVHLMISHPERYVDEIADCGADIITVHAEACTHLHRTVMQIKEKGVKAGVSLNPATPLSVLEYVLDQLDLILIMSVNPGFGGQKYIETSTEKIRKLREWLDQEKLQANIEVDGGISLSNARTVLEAGANILVAGSAVFGGDVASNTRAFLKMIQEYQEEK